MIKNKKTRYLLIGILIAILITVGGMLTWTNQTYKPTEDLMQMVSTEEYELVDDFYVFGPKGEDKKTGIVLYPGALVEPLAYGYYANELSKAGYLVAVPNVRFNLSITDNNKAEEFIQEHKEIEEWYVGGHSMGGVSAAMYAEKNDDIISGLILLGSYPASSTQLADNPLKVLNLYAEYDGLTTLDEIEESKKNLPDSTQFIEIKGGNHAQFGMYGEQKKDGQAQIDALMQQKEAIQQTLKFLEA